MLERLSKLIVEYCHKNDIDYRTYAIQAGVSSMEVVAIAGKLIKEDDLKLSTVNKILAFHHLSLGIMIGTV